MMHFQAPSTLRPHISQRFPLYNYIYPHICIFTLPLQTIPPRICFRFNDRTASKNSSFKLHRHSRPILIYGFPYIFITAYLVTRCIFSLLDWSHLLIWFHFRGGTAKKTYSFCAASAFRPHVYKGFPLYISVHSQFSIFIRPLFTFPPPDCFRLVINFQIFVG